MVAEVPPKEYRATVYAEDKADAMKLYFEANELQELATLLTQSMEINPLEKLPYIYYSVVYERHNGDDWKLLQKELLVMQR